MSRIRRATAIVGALVAVVLLTGCEPPDPGATTSPTGTPTVEPVKTSPVATAVPTAEPKSTAHPLTCDSIVPQSRLDWIASQGWTLFPPDEFFAKLNSEGQNYPELFFQRNGGIVCPYGAGFHVNYVYGYSPMPESEWANISSSIITGDPFVENNLEGGPLF